jgi:putative ABC transport system substrate-binding protein
MIRRREAITVLSGTAVAWPLAARSQQPGRVRRIGVLMDTAESNAEGRARLDAFRQGLGERGWIAGRSFQLELRWPAADVTRAQADAAEIVALAPDAVLAVANAQIRPLSKQTRTIPIVFVGASDPVGSGYVASFARPGGNITGFTLFEAPMAGKWLAALKEVAPAIKRAAILVNPETGTLRGTLYLSEFQKAAAALGVEPQTASVRDAREIEAAVAALGIHPGSGLVVAPDGFAQAHDALIVSLAAKHRVPAVYGVGNFARSGGLISYGPDFPDVFRRAATYVDRILRGETPADLPVQAPAKFELLINLRSAKALGLELPAALLARTDEVIE